MNSTMSSTMDVTELEHLPKRWLILAHGFNMDGRAASQTITDKVPYLLAAGLELTVFSAVTGSADQRFTHRQFFPWGPAGLRFDFRHWLAIRCGRGFIYKVLTVSLSVLLAPFIALERLIAGYSSQWSWALPAAWHGIQLARAGKIDLVYSTGGAWSAHLAAKWIKRYAGKNTQLKWLAEIHDPLVMRSNEHDDGLNAPSEREAHFRFQLEKQICLHADRVWWFTPGALSYAQKRNPNLLVPDSRGKLKGLVVLPGANPPRAETMPPTWRASNNLHLTHFGSLSHTRSLQGLLNALPAFFSQHPEARKHLRIDIYGSDLDALSARAIQEHQLSDVVITHGRLEFNSANQQSGREQVNKLMREADILLLLHGNSEWCAEYIPSKAYEYFWAQRPILALTHRNPAFDQLLGEYHAYIAEQSNPRAIIAALEQIYAAWQQQQMPVISAKPLGVDQAVQTILHAVSELN
jgi:hypothetical protein